MAKRPLYLDYVPPVRIFGNLYFAGTHSASVHLIDTGEGLIMLDSGYPGNAMYVVNAIYTLGFSVRDIKYIVHSHGHYDHLGSTRAFLRLTDAVTFLGEEDIPLATGEDKRTLAEVFGAEFKETFSPDVALRDGMEISLGNTCIRCVSTPGHTPGTVSFFFDVREGERVLRAGMHGGVGLNSLTREFLSKNHYPLSMRDAYFASLDKVENEHVDIPLGNHVANNQTEEKIARLLAGDREAFIDPNGWGRFLENCREGLSALTAEEESGIV